MTYNPFIISLTCRIQPFKSTSYYMDMESNPEKDLLQSARSFDMDALAQIFDMYGPGISTYSLRLLGNPHLADECVAETFSRFLHALKAGRGPETHLKGYLYRTAHNWVVDWYRRQPHQTVLHENIPSNLEDSPPEKTEDRHEKQKIRAALQRLTPDQRQVIALRFLEGWDLQQVADLIQKPVGAVKSLQHRALENLRQLFLTDQSL